MIHQHRDFRCPDCGALITCIACVEVNAGSIPHGPGFINLPADFISPAPHVPVIETPTVELQIRPEVENAPLTLPATATIHQQQSLFA